MWRKISGVVGMVCLCAYAVTFLGAAVEIFMGAAAQRQSAALEFDELVGYVRAAGAGNFLQASFREDIRDTVVYAKSLVAVIVSADSGKQYAVEKDDTGALLSDGEFTTFRPHLFFRKPYTAEMQFGGAGIGTVSAVAPYLNTGLLLTILRRALLVVLITTVTAFVLLVLDITAFGRRVFGAEASRSYGASPASAVQESGAPPPPPHGAPSSAGGGGEDRDVLPLSTPIAEDDFARQDGAPADVEGEEAKQAEAEGDDLELVLDDMEGGDAGGEAEGIFRNTLEEDLRGAILLGQELALLHISASDGSAPSESVFTLAVDFWKREDRTFNLEKRGLFVILAGMDLDTAFKEGRFFHNHVMEQIALGDVDPGLSGLVTGVSARQGRSVGAARLVGEAMSASRKARDEVDGEPVVAFKIDPERWAVFEAEHDA